MESMAELGPLSSESIFSAPPTDASSNTASLSSTPPTTVSPDSISLASDPDILKLDAVTAPLVDSALQKLENEQPLQSASETLPEAEARLEAITTARQQTPLEAEAPQDIVAPGAVIVAEPPPPIEPSSTTRAQRARSSLPVYNLTQLSGTRRVRGAAAADKRRRTISGDTLVNEEQNEVNGSADTIAGPSTSKSGQITQKAKYTQPPEPITRRATRHSGAPAESLVTTLSTLGKRSRKTFEKVQSRLTRELRRLQDTNEFAHIDTRPIRHTVWSNGKFVDPRELQESPASPARKKARVSEPVPGQDTKAAEVEKQKSIDPPAKKRRTKKWLEKGLYAGQEAPTDISKGFTTLEKKKLASMPELMPSAKINSTFPVPIFNGLRMLANGRDFKLPFDVCNPLPPGQPKPAAYRTMTKNRFVGDAAAYWKKTPHFEDFASRCVCKPEDGCGEDCQNRIMLYECDETNCSAGKAHCTNRAFQNLQERTKKGGRFRVGVEVLKTSDRGYGVRSNRCFEPNQIIMEYTGEIITEEECERRMNEVYKDNECYYLMSFDQNMIIDATTGSIARFVNHSCSPNCRMIKWIVSGQPRMALFAGDRPIMTGDELTYDYNFDPFSAKNVQKCLCGSPNCRGVLGPKPKEVKLPKPPKEDKKKSVKGSMKAGKRKLKELLAGDGDEEEVSKAAKKRKIKTPTGVKGAKTSLSVSSLKAAKGAAKGAATAIKRSVSTISLNAKSAMGATSARVQARRASTTSLLRTYSKKTRSPATVKVSSRNSSLTLVTSTTSKSGKQTPKNTPKKTGTVSKTDTPKSVISVSSSARKRTPSWKALASDETPGSSAKSLKVGSNVRSGIDLSRSSNLIRVVQDSE